MNMLDIDLQISWSREHQTMIGHVRIHDGELTYAHKIVKHHSPLYIQLVANNLWMETTFSILEQEYPTVEEANSVEQRVEQALMFDENLNSTLT